MEKIELKRGNIAVYVVLLAVTMILMIMASRCSGRSTGEGVGADTLRVAIQISPMGVSTGGDTLCGFYYDMVREMAAANGMAITIEGFTQASDALDRLDRGDYDIVIADIPATLQMHDRYLLTDPIYTDREVLVQLRDSITGQPPITSQTQLRGDTVHLPAGSPMMSRIENLARELGDTIHVIEDSDYGPEQLIILTALGEIKNCVVNEQVARTMAADYPQLDVSLPMSFNQFQTWAVQRGDSALLLRLNSQISAYKATSAFQRLIDRYIKGNVGT